MSVTIKEVVTRKDLKRFVHFPNEFYKDNKYISQGLCTTDHIEMSQVKKIKSAFKHYYFFVLIYFIM